MIDKFPAYPKTPRFNMDCLVTEKIDGTNACVVIEQDFLGAPCAVCAVLTAENGTPPVCGTDYVVRAGSRKRWITPEKDNFGFARFVEDNREWLIENLGPGIHYGEWWGKGIQRGYDQDGRTLSLFDGPGRYPFVVNPDCALCGCLTHEGACPGLGGLCECGEPSEQTTLMTHLVGGRIGVVPLLFTGSLLEVLRFVELPELLRNAFLPWGSEATPGYYHTEGIVVSLRGSGGGGQRFKVVWDKR